LCNVRYSLIFCEKGAIRLHSLGLRDASRGGGNVNANAALQESRHLCAAAARIGKGLKKL
jgi:hypothetical protein